MAAKRELPGDAGDAVKAGLYRLVIGFLGAALLAGIVGALVLTGMDRPVPDGIVAVVGLVAGALVGVLAPSPGS